MHEGQGAKAEADDGWGSAILIVIKWLSIMEDGKTPLLTPP